LADGQAAGEHIELADVYYREGFRQRCWNASSSIKACWMKARRIALFKASGLSSREIVERTIQA
jgi:hypothetical protein